MKPFLSYVADDLRRKFGNDLSRVTVVFPNRRAGLFLNEYLAPAATDGRTETVIWSPRYVTISELFTSLSPLRVADTIETVCRIYRLYVHLTGSTDTLDFFYGWGERLLADFDDVDKNMADAAKLFRNLSEIKQLEGTDYVNDEQERVLQEFFADFSLKNNSDLKKKFLELWNVLFPLYQSLNETLAEEGLAYEGALYRRVADGLVSGSVNLPETTMHYAIVGFNVLDKVEETLFSRLRDCGKASFYWDYDTLYASETSGFEAGTFLKNNLELFPNALPPQCFDNLRHIKDIEFVSAPTENIQARAVAPWLRQHLTADEKETAVVLCNEVMLQPLLHALPPEVKEANITKGYPLHHTVVYRSVERAIAGRGTESNAVWLVATMEAVHREAVAVETRNESLDKTLDTEACFLLYTTLQRFYRLLKAGWLEVEAGTLHKLLRQVVRQISVPFHGEPAAGLQVMGVLETRCLDFRNLLMLSVNEGRLPQCANDNSFIPYALRREFGLTTSRHKTAVYAYYFFRLIQRAEHVRLVYNCSTGNGGAGEMSRFMKQLLIDTQLPIRQLALSSPLSVTPVRRFSIAKPDNLADILRQLSPSAINTYLRCPVCFFYQRVAKLKAPEPTADIIAPNKLGTLFHKSAELFYSDLSARRNGNISPDMLCPCLLPEKKQELMKYVKRAVAKENIASGPLVEEIVCSYLRQLIQHDARLGNFCLAGMEQRHGLDLAIPLAGKKVNVRVEGIIDRLDYVQAADGDGGETLRVVDYKTGGEPEKASGMAALFTPALKHPHYILQAFVYSLIMCGETAAPIKPALFYVHKAAGTDYSPGIVFNKEEMQDFRPIADDFRAGLIDLLACILDPSTRFECTETASFCRSCVYADLCQR